MKLRVLEVYGGIGFRGRQPGSIVDLAPGLATEWIKRGYAEPLETQRFDNPVKVEEDLTPPVPTNEEDEDRFLHKKKKLVPQTKKEKMFRE